MNKDDLEELVRQLLQEVAAAKIITPNMRRKARRALTEMEKSL